MTAQELRRFVEDGFSLLVGTVGADGEPACCRGLALTGNEDLTRLTLYVSVETAQQAIANVATSRRVAVTVSNPLDHASVQFKGWSQLVRLARGDEADLITSRIDSFGEKLSAIGCPRSVTARVTRWPAFAIEMSVEAVYDQTPGLGAGREVE